MLLYTMTTTLKRQYAINKKLATAYTKLKQTNATLAKRNRTLVNKLKRISNERNAKRAINERNKNTNAWLRKQAARRRQA